MSKIKLMPLQPEDREQFILDNQWAFKYGSLEEFGPRNDQFEEEGEIISRKTIENSIDQGEAYRIMCESKWFMAHQIGQFAMASCLFRPHFPGKDTLI